MPTEVENVSAMTASNSASGEASISSTGGQPDPPPPPAAAKRKRNLPGTPDPDAEVIALSPKTLMATNRFVCEICSKGFQRDQNLQLHRRGHNLPWKLRQRSGKEVRKRVYVCPESTCVHHDPARALGDLTGIKKHFSRKHGEKKYKCEKCSKKYAVQSDWKAHTKICGTREYRCDCGTLFSRRDSFITHRAFCDALAEESAKAQVAGGEAAPAEDEETPEAVAAPSSSPSSAMVNTTLPHRALLLPAEQPRQEPETAKQQAAIVQPILPPRAQVIDAGNGSGNGGAASNPGNGTLFANLFASAAARGTNQVAPTFSDLMGGAAMSGNDPRAALPPSAAEPVSPCFSQGGSPSLFSAAVDRRPLRPPSPHMSATALLQKAAQMGATSSNPSLLRGFGFSSSSTTPQKQENFLWRDHHQHHLHHHHLPEEPASMTPALGLGLPYGGAGAGGMPGLVMGPPPFFLGKPTTLDLLGIGRGGSAAGGLSALITSIGGSLERTGSEPAAAAFGGGGAPAKAWDSSALFSSSSRSS